MNTKIIGIKDFRRNISKLTKEGKEQNTTYLVTIRNKPAFEVKPCLNNSVELDSTQVEYYQSLEKSLDFWNDQADDDIFAIPKTI